MNTFLPVSYSARLSPKASTDTVPGTWYFYIRMFVMSSLSPVLCLAFGAMNIETNLKTVSFQSLSECRLSGKVKLDKEETIFDRQI
jgi:hypothetical protein